MAQTVVFRRRQRRNESSAILATAEDASILNRLRDETSANTPRFSLLCDEFLWARLEIGS
jgi:hypothetical protein